MIPKSAHRPYPPPEHITNKKILQLYEERTKEGSYDLTPGEKWWRDRANLFEHHGYKLRPRYLPGWKPSWLGTDLHPFTCEDSHTVVVSCQCYYLFLRYPKRSLILGDSNY